MADSSYYINIITDLSSTNVSPVTIGAPIQCGDRAAHVIRVRLYRDGTEFKPTSSYTVTGYFQCPSSSTPYSVSGSISGNTCTVTVPNNAYSKSGEVVGIVRLVYTSGGSASSVVTIAKIFAYVSDDVSQSGSNAQTSVWTVSQIEGYINRMVSAVNSFNATGMESHVGNSTIHVTAEDKARWNSNSVQGDTVNNTTLTQMVNHISNGAIHVTSTDKAKWNLVTNANLLDNWYFGGGNIVNQRGATSYTGSKFGFDRWRTLSSSATVEQGDGYLTCNTSLYQPIPNIPSAVLTVSALFSDGSLRSVTSQPSQSNAGYSDSAENNVMVGLDRDNSRVYVRNLNFGIVAVKLEIGEKQTLAHQDSSGSWVLNEIPDYGEQLRRCQRYYYKYVGTVNTYMVMNGSTVRRAVIMLPVKMHTIPSITTGSVSNGTIDGFEVQADHVVFKGTATAANANLLCTNFTALVDTYGGDSNG